MTYMESDCTNYIEVTVTEEIVNKFPIQMLIHNDIQGFIHVSLIGIDNTYQLKYDIGEGNTLEEQCGIKKLTGQDLKQLIYRIVMIMNQANRFFLDLDNISMKLKNIYVLNP